LKPSKEVIDKRAAFGPIFEREFREDAMVRTVHYGTHIEGNELNLSEAEKVLLGQQIQLGIEISRRLLITAKHGLY